MKILPFLEPHKTCLPCSRAGLKKLLMNAFLEGSSKSQVCGYTLKYYRLAYIAIRL
jgi:hypothetical protein